MHNSPHLSNTTFQPKQPIRAHKCQLLPHWGQHTAQTPPQVMPTINLWHSPSTTTLQLMCKTPTHTSSPAVFHPCPTPQKTASHQISFEGMVVKQPVHVKAALTEAAAAFSFFASLLCSSAAAALAGRASSLPTFLPTFWDSVAGST